MSFDNFVNRAGAEDQARKKRESEKPLRLAAWKKDCDDLFASIEQLIRPTLDKGVLKVKYGKNWIDDPDFDRYECRVMIFELGSSAASLTPKWSFGGGYNGLLEFNRAGKKPDMGMARPKSDRTSDDWKILYETPKQGAAAHLRQTDHKLSDLNVDNIQQTLQYLLS